MSKKIVLASAMILGATNAAFAVDCKTSPDMTARGKWSVESVDGKICWFLGNSGTPKEDLRWPGSAKARVRKDCQRSGTEAGRVQEGREPTGAR